MAEGDGRCGRDLPSAALDARRSLAAPARRPATGERAGVVVRMPAAWRGNRPPRPRVTAHGRRQAAVGTRPGRAARFPDGGHARRRTADRRRDPRAAGAIRWAGAGARPLGRSRSRAPAAACSSASAKSSARPRRTGSAFGEAMRLLAGADVAPGDAAAVADADWAQVVAGPWLAETLAGPAQSGGTGASRSRRGAARRRCGRTSRWACAGSICSPSSGWAPAWPTTWGWARPFRCCRCCWCCKRQDGGQPQPSLLVAPASLLANWAAEIERFAPGLKALIAHPSAMPAAELKALAPERLRGRRPGHHQLRLAAARAVDRRSRLAPGRPGRSAGDQEPRRQADARRQGAEGAARGSRSPARRSRTGWAISGPSSTSSIRGCWDRRRSSRPSPSGWRTARTIRTARCASWCGPTFCGG